MTSELPDYFLNLQTAFVGIARPVLWSGGLDCDGERVAPDQQKSDFASQGEGYVSQLNQHVQKNQGK